MKFKVGDRVRVRDDSKYSGGKYASAIGTVRHIVTYLPHMSKYPYDVEFDEIYGLPVNNFHAHELEAV